VFSGAVISFLWGWLVYNGDISTIWPMFGVSNQLLATLALSIGTIYILQRSGKWYYALVTFVPSLFMFATTFVAGIENITDNYLPKHTFQGNLNAVLTVVMLVLVVIIFFEAHRKCAQYLWRTAAVPGLVED
jgi:carbon starvation protein